MFPVPSELHSLKNIVISKTLYVKNVAFSLEILLNTQWNRFSLLFYKSQPACCCVVHRTLVLCSFFTSLWGGMCIFANIQTKWVSLKISEPESGGQVLILRSTVTGQFYTHSLATNLIDVSLRSLKEAALCPVLCKWYWCYASWERCRGPPVVGVG